MVYRDRHVWFFFFFLSYLDPNVPKDTFFSLSFLTLISIFSVAFWFCPESVFSLLELSALLCKKSVGPDEHSRYLYEIAGKAPSGVMLAIQEKAF